MRLWCIRFISSIQPDYLSLLFLTLCLIFAQDLTLIFTMNGQLSLVSHADQLFIALNLMYTSAAFLKS